MYIQLNVDFMEMMLAHDAHWEDFSVNLDLSKTAQSPCIKKKAPQGICETCFLQ